MFLRPLHDAVLLVHGELGVDGSNLGFGPWVQDHWETLHHGNVMSESVLVDICLQAKLLQQLDQEIWSEEGVHYTETENGGGSHIKLL